MTGMDRRRFLKIAGGTAALTAMSSSIARAAAIPAARRTGTLRDIEHVVVLMQENRSFDHYFGTLRGVRGFGDPRTANQPNGKPVWYQSDGAKDVLPFHPDAKNLGLQFLQDLPHDWNTGHAALANGAYDKWVPAKSATTMAYLNRGDIPFHYALADAFTICDAYHCSLLGPTDPNRYYMWTGYTGNDGAGGGPVITNAEAGYSWRTYPERLEQAGVSWKIYQDIGNGLDAAGSWGWTQDAYIGNYGDNSLLYFDNYRNAAPGSPLFEKARTGTNVAKTGGFFDLLKADVAANRLPQVSWIVAPEAFTEHPNWPVNYGAWYISQVLDALTANPAVWSKTALLITYDENDGFFDHVIPPFPASTPAQGASTADVSAELYRGKDGVPGPYGLGQRVPMIVVSPWSTGGYVCSQTFDHTSIVQFLEARFGVREPNISPWRRAVCGDLTSAFDFSQARQGVPALPSTSGYFPPDRNRHPDYVPTPPANPSLPQQEPGRRPARALPYHLSADGTVRAGKLTIDFASRGRAGAGFLVTSPRTPGGPWTYTVEPGKALTATWPVVGSYDFTVHGPNGFVRQLAGAAAPGPEVSARDAGDRVVLALSNNGPVPVTLTIADHYGHQPTAAVRLAPGARAEHVIDPSASADWYDVTITSDHDPAYRRTLAGHLETGRPSTSDPAIGSR
ncbi:phospholipase C, phosphocholine-specific [Amycolatopsis sp. AA4]|uniref:phosphocholine-specific phospholipase C n=1 Tax=Actinomycetes TaxID=1760 RepID=UPI0001DEE2E8|nr:MULTISPECIES: phospholipase C, phosphocholine-specific [Actinomycetes]ATY12282.1 phospholipase C, phosphocholine-specific [Amycolatopsis sp. AA4]EFL08021.1 phospholipase C, phosphocholine-specific [Streptomyces sp. AA4]